MIFKKKKKKTVRGALLTFAIHDILNDTHYDNIISRNYEGLKNTRKLTHLYIYMYIYYQII